MDFGLQIFFNRVFIDSYITLSYRSLLPTNQCMRSTLIDNNLLHYYLTFCPTQVTKKDHPMYWKGKSQSSGLMGYFPSENVKMYSLSRQDSTASSVSSITSRSASMNSQHKLYDYSWFVGEMDRNGGRSDTSHDVIKYLLI